MSLALAIRGADGLVLASDSRVSSPEGREDTSEKFVQVNRDTGVMTYGAAVPGFNGISSLARQVRADQEHYSTFDAIADLAQTTFQQAYQEFIDGVELPEGVELDQVRSQLAVGFVLGGYDHVKNNFQVVRYNSGEGLQRTEVRQKRTFAAAQWHIAEFLFNHVYYPEMAVEQLVDFAVMILLETQTTEDSVGGPIQLAMVTLEQGYQRLHEQDIRPIIRRNQPRIARLRQVLGRGLLEMEARLHVEED